MKAVGATFYTQRLFSLLAFCAKNHMMLTNDFAK